MRLINGDDINLILFERGQIDKRFKWGETIRYTPSEVQQIINEDMPTVDAMPVVFCSECKYNNSCFTQSFIESEGVLPFDRDTWFCADGKRKGGADDAAD